METLTKGEATRQAILTHAVGVASTDGLEGITVGRLATDLGMSKSGLFAHFKSKEALQIAVLDAAADAFVDEVVRPALAAPRGEERLRTAFQAWMEWGRRLPGGCPFAVASIEFDDKPGPVRDRIASIQADWIEFLATCVRSGQKSGAFRSDIDPELIAWELQGIGLSTYQAARLLRDRRALERAHASFQRVLASLLP